MNLQRIKMIVSALWMLSGLVVILAINSSVSVNIVLAAIGGLPPLALLLLWNDPSPSLSESIREARR